MKKLFFLSAVLAASLTCFAQPEDDLLNSLDTQAPASANITKATFKGTRLINFHTVETLGKGSLDFRIAHRFGDIGNGVQTLFGLDGPAAIQFSFDYSLSDRLVVGLARTNVNKLVDGVIKYRLLRQTNDNKMPLSVTVMGMANITHRAAITPGEFDNFAHRMSYFAQVIVGRKFNERLSLQLSPMYIHYNLVDLRSDKNDMIALAASGRYKFTKRLALTAEYSYVLNPYTADRSQYTNSASVGLDIETGGHVFQLFFTNSFAINEAQLVPYTTQKWSEGQFRWGFNVSRVFSL